MRTSPIPKYRHHKARDLAVVRIDGKDRYLGKFNSPESHVKYRRLLVKYCQGSLSRPVRSVTVSIFAALYEERCNIRHQGATRNSYRRTINEFCALFPQLDTYDLKYWHIEAFQTHLIKTRERTAATINDHLARLKRIFLWAVRKDYMPANAIGFFELLERVKSNWPGVKARRAINPVPLELIHKVLPDLPLNVAAMIMFQLKTACRPGEARLLRHRDIDKSEQTWHYIPPTHKTAHLGKKRTIPIGYVARDVIEKQSTTHLEHYVFHTGNPLKTYTKDSYARAIRRACERAGITPHWTPNQLRHAAATAIRKEWGIEAAQAVLGHSRINTTEIYAQQNVALASKIAEQMG